MTKLQTAARLMAQRLQVFQKIAAQAIERGEETIELATAEFWESKDTEALAAFEDALHEINGERPLPFRDTTP